MANDIFKEACCKAIVATNTTSNNVLQCRRRSNRMTSINISWYATMANMTLITNVSQCTIVANFQFKWPNI